MPARAARVLAVLVCLGAAVARAGEVRLVIQEDHERHVTCAAFSRDGQLLATGCRDGAARVFDLASGRIVRRIDGHPRGVASLAFSPDGRFLATGAEDARARLWRLDDGTESRRFHGHLPHVEIMLARTPWPEAGRVTALAVSADGRRLLTAANDSTARLWDTATGREIRAFEGHRTRVFVAALLDGDRRVLTAGQDGTARLWDAETGREVLRVSIRRAEGLARRIRCAALTPDGRKLVTGCADGVLRVWETSSGREVLSMAGEKELVAALRIEDGGDTAVAGFADGSVRRFDLAIGEETSSWTGGPVLAFNDDGSAVAMEADRHRVDVRDSRSGRLLVRLGGTVERVRSAAFAPDGSRLLLGLANGTVALHDLVEGGADLTDATSSEAVTALVQPSGPETVAVGDGDGVLRLLGPGSVWNRPLGTAGQGEVLALASTPAGKMLVSACSDGSVWTWDLESSKRAEEFLLRPGRLSDLAMDPAGVRVAVAVGRWVELFDLSSGFTVADLDGHFAEVTSVRFSSDGRSVLTGSADGTVRLWSADEGQLLRRFDGMLNEVVAAVPTPDLRRVVAVGEAGTVLVWETATGALVRRVEGILRAPRSMALAPDGRSLLFLGDGPEVVIASLPEVRPAGRVIHVADRGWAVVDPHGRYDMSAPGAAEAFHWRFGTDVVTPDLLAIRYRTPGLLRRILGRDDSPRPRVRPIGELGPPPRIEVEPLSPGSPVLRVSVEDRGGGIGSTVLRVDGRAVALAGAGGEIDLSVHGARPGSRIEISVHGEGDHLRSRTRVFSVGSR